MSGKRIPALAMAAAVALGLWATVASGKLFERAPAIAAANLTGRMLVAEPSLDAGIFARTVIYMISHGRSGAMGVIVNLPTGERPIREMLRGFAGGDPGGDDDGAGGNRNVTVFFGGPVDRKIGFFLHSPDFSAAETVRINPLASATAASVVLRAMAAGKGPQHGLLALGYAGWAPGQLEREIAEKSWIVVPAEADILFDKDHSTKWRRAYSRRGIDL